MSGGAQAPMSGGAQMGGGAPRNYNNAKADLATDLLRHTCPKPF